MDLLAPLAVLCAAERDICGAGQGDPAFDGWFRDAEAARSAVVSAAKAVVLATPQSRVDQQFRSACYALTTLLCTSDAEPFASATSFLQRQAVEFCDPAGGFAQAASLFRSFYEAFDFLMTLPDYTLEPLSFAPEIALAA
ncbi:hypothetical protein [Cypionkella psychrotolerans]|uniref:hypothetical protein n=1 Tax=Cypionkella psychrotolerans TaxID=1678131 RepID=UPI0006B46041|nr:hypothetical protein [Cypionkella psychrotolerans]